MAEHMSQSELDYPFKLLEYFNGFRVSKVNISRFIFGKCQSDLMCVDSDFLHYMQELLKYYKLDWGGGSAYSHSFLTKSLPTSAKLLTWQVFPQVIFSACELGVFDLLLRSQEPLSAQHVAQELGTSLDGMERLLDALVGIEILEVEKTDGTGEE